ncbi:MAG: SusC/RagA family TonB-linked outer membrane protein [Saprospiraceae bacterium]
MKQHLLLLVGLFFSTLAFAQQSVSGTVTDELGDPVIGATVVVTGTSTGTATDFDGKWELSVPDGSESLTVSYIGYDKKVVALDGSGVVDITIAEGVALNEVVVTGYSVGTKREATGAISTVSSAELSAIPSGNVEQQLQGRAAGVTVISNGQPGTESKVRVRGFGSFSDNRPLYIVDGVPSNGIGFLPPEDIESTSVLKDAASASIYGARAASGVIVVQTKQGSRKGGMKVTYDALVGVTDPGQGQEILSPTQQAQVIYQGLKNDVYLAGDDPDAATITSDFYDFSDPNNIGIPDYLVSGDRTAIFGEPTAAEIAAYNDDLTSGSPISLIIPTNKEGNNWYDDITRRAFLTRHNLGFSGGAERGRYYFGLSYQDQEGILINNSFKRYNIRSNSEFDVIPNRLRVGENFSLAYIQNLGQQGPSGGQGVANQESAILEAFRASPLIPSRIGVPGGALTGYGGNVGNNGLGNARNPLAQREALSNNTNNNVQSFGNVYAELDIIKGLYVKTLFGGTYGSYNGRGFGRAQYENIENQLSTTYNEFNGYYGSWVFTNTLNFDYKIGTDHSFKGLVGYEANKLDISYFTSAGGNNPFIADPSFVSITQVQAPVVNSGFGTQKTFASTFGQVNYNYQGKYYVTGVVRRDESSAFASGQRAGIFPAISAAWRVTGEEFAQPNNILTDLKLRAGYGIMGNSNAVGIGNQFNSYSGNVGNSGYDINGTNSTAAVGFLQSQIANVNAQWEESTTVNVGAEATFFGTKLDVVLDLWQKRNEGVLFNVALPSVNGSGAAPFVNVATIDNKGIDLLVTYRDKAGEFDWEATVTGSILKNEIIEIAPGIDFFDSGGQARLSGSAVRNRVGQPISSFFGYQVDRLWQESDFRIEGDGTLEIGSGGGVIFADGTEATNGEAPGRFKYVDLNGIDDEGNITSGADGMITAEDRTQIGNAVPKFTGGLNLRVGYKGFDIETFLYTSLGNDVLNNSRYYTDFLQTFTSGSAKSTRILEAWTPTNTGTDIPIAESVSNFSTNAEINSYYVESGDYLRMRVLSLGYSLPDSALKGVFSKARFSVTATNLFTISGYTGLDPAVGGAADTNFGIDVGNYPVTRSLNFGVSLGF